jgi:hypothetical protein
MLSLPTMTVLRRLVDNMLDRLYLQCMRCALTDIMLAEHVRPPRAISITPCHSARSLASITLTGPRSRARPGRRQLTGTVAREPQLVHTISPSPLALHLAPLTMEMMPVLTPLLTLVLALTWKVLVETPFRRKSSIHTRFFTSLEVLQG